jgi:chromate reductase
MPAQRTVAVLVGSLRKEAFSRKAAKALVSLAPATLAFDFIDIGTVSFFNQDLEASPPADWVAFRERIKAADAVLFVTPEYNRSVPGVLKNAIDVGSRPYGQSVFNGKPAGIVSVSPGAIGGFGANHNLRQSLMFLNMPALQQPEAYINNAGALFDVEGKLTNDSTRDFFANYMKSFAAWIEKHKG